MKFEKEKHSMSTHYSNEAAYYEELISAGIPVEDAVEIVAKAANDRQEIFSEVEHRKGLQKAGIGEEQAKRMAKAATTFYRDNRQEPTEQRKSGFNSIQKVFGVKAGNGLVKEENDFDEINYYKQLVEAGLPIHEAKSLATKTAAARRQSQGQNTEEKQSQPEEKKPTTNSANSLTNRLNTIAETATSRYQQMIQSQARPGETYEQARIRYLQESDEDEIDKPQRKKPASSLRKPPKDDAQGDLLVPTLYDIGTKDSRSIMDVAVYRLSKVQKRQNEVIRYEVPDGFVEVRSGPAGMASIWDYDIVIMAISQITEAMNAYRSGRGEKPGRIFRPHANEILKFCRRSSGGRQKDDLVDALLRLNTTHVQIERPRTGPNGKAKIVTSGEPLISSYTVISNPNGKIDCAEIELPKWLYNEIVEVKTPDVLTVHPDFFLIEPGLGRFLYRLARRAAGKAQAKWTLQLVYERSGSASSFKEFSRMIRGLIEANDLPEYSLELTAGKYKPLLVMTHRDYVPPVPAPEEDAPPPDNAPPEAPAGV